MTAAPDTAELTRRAQTLRDLHHSWEALLLANEGDAANATVGGK
jgi:hypothetical protein